MLLMNQVAKCCLVMFRVKNASSAGPMSVHQAVLKTQEMQTVSNLRKCQVQLTAIMITRMHREDEECQERRQQRLRDDLERRQREDECRARAAERRQREEEQRQQQQNQMQSQMNLMMAAVTDMKDYKKNGNSHDDDGQKDNV